MTNWVRTIATGQLHNISFRITEVWNELNKSKVKNPPDLVLNSQIAYATLNRMVTTMKIAWSEAPMVNVFAASTTENSEDLTPFRHNNCFSLWDTGAIEHI